MYMCTRFVLLLSVLVAQAGRAACFVAPTVCVKPPQMLLNADPNLREDDNENSSSVEKVEDQERRALLINSVSAGLAISTVVASANLYYQLLYTPSGFQRLPTTQFIAALGDPNASEGTTAKEWGLWREDPGPRGVFLKDYGKDLQGNGGVAPRGWKFDGSDWWLEEHGIIMEPPRFPISPGRYLVTGGRSVTTGLTIEADGSWKLDEGTLYDVTHLPCRSARYKPNEGSGSPLTAKQSDFPVRPGAEMPSVLGCNKQDYAVLFLVGKAV